MAKQKKQPVRTEQIDCSLCVSSFPANSKRYCENKLADKSILKDSAIVDKKDDCNLFKEIR